MWHGASLSFVLWGGAHGLLLCLEKALAAPLMKLRALPAGRALLGLLTLHLVVLLWIPFRTTDLALAWSLVQRITVDFQLAGVPQVLEARAILLAVLGLGALLGTLRHEQLTRLGEGFARCPLPLRAALALLVVQLTLELQNAELQPFFYFQF